MEDLGRSLPAPIFADQGVEGEGVMIIPAPPSQNLHLRLAPGGEYPPDSKALRAFSNSLTLVPPHDEGMGGGGNEAAVPQRFSRSSHHHKGEDQGLFHTQKISSEKFSPRMLEILQSPKYIKSYIR